MERITNKEKARKITIKLEGEIGTSPHSRQAIEESILEMAKWKDEQHKQELIRIYNFVSPYLTPEANNDLKIIIGIC